MRLRPSILFALVAAFAVAKATQVSGADFHGQVLDRESKQPVNGVVVQECSLHGLGPNGQRVVLSGFTNSHGQFRLPMPAGIDTRDLFLMVTRKPSSTRETFLNGQGLLLTSFKDVIGMNSHPSTQSANVIYANFSPCKNLSPHEPAH